MINKKCFLSLFFFIQFVFFNNADELDVSKFYLQKAYGYYKADNYDLAKESLDNAFGSSKIFPEYYYFSNLILPQKQENNSVKKINADSIIKYLKNNFLIEDYELLKHCFQVYENVKDFNNASKCYDQIFAMQKVNDVNDSLNYVKMLIYSYIPEYFRQVPAAIEQAKKKNDVIDFNFYLLLYRILSNNVTYAEFNSLLNTLSANNYEASRILYLKILYYNDPKIILGLLNDYYNLKKGNKIDKEYYKKIIYNLVFKVSNISSRNCIVLLNDYYSLNKEDALSLDFINNKSVSSIIRSDETLKNEFLNYTGKKYLDLDEDGWWEEYYEYKNGILLKKVLDKNQDGIKEEETNYLDNGKINNYISYQGKNSDFIVYDFNPLDQSLEIIEHYKGNKIIKKTGLVKSSYFPKINELRNFNEKNILQKVDYIEEWNNAHEKSFYDKGIIQYKNIDADNNNIFEKKIVYTNGSIDYILIDSNENGLYETLEKYQNNNKIYVLNKSKENGKIYDYKEEYYKDRVNKYWDYNEDGIYEICIEEYKNGFSREKYDINFDGKYDYIFEKQNNILTRILKVNQVNGKEVVIRTFENKKEQEKLNGWIVVTAKDISSIKTPESILLKDKRILSGIFKYKGVESIFTKGKIESNDFTYNLMLINDQIYLFDDSF